MLLHFKFKQSLYRVPYYFQVTVNLLTHTR